MFNSFFYSSSFSKPLCFVFTLKKPFLIQRDPANVHHSIEENEVKEQLFSKKGN